MTMKNENVKRHNQIVGKWGEDIAANFLTRHGFALIGRNVRTPEGEIDLILKKEGELVFCEVKTRSLGEYGYPEDAVTDEKMEHMLASAESYLGEHPEFAENWRIDVVAVIGNLNDPQPQIEWFENAV
jgi:putative endonuclease